MKFEINRKVFVESLKIAMGVVAKNGITAILSSVKIEAVDDSLQITGMNVSQRLITSVESKVIETGAVVLNANRLFKVINTLQGAECIVDVDTNNYTTIICGSAVIQINGTPAGGYPPADEIDYVHHVSVGADEFKEMLKLVSYAVGTDTGRVALKGVFLEINQDYMACVATDGRRLAISTIEKIKGAEETLKLLLPIELVNVLSSWNSDGVIISVDKLQKNIRVTDTTTEIYSKLIGEIFPPYAKVIPQTLKEKVVLDTKVFSEKLLNVMSLCKENTIVTFMFENNTLTISTDDFGDGKAVDTMEIEYKNPVVKMSFNGVFIVQMLKATKADKITWEFNGDLMPCKITIGEHSFNVIMPIRKKGA